MYRVTLSPKHGHVIAFYAYPDHADTWQRVMRAHGMVCVFW
jgi:hypothetical protein